MKGGSPARDEWIRARALALTGQAMPGTPVVWDDTTGCMSIERDHVIDLEGDLFLVRGNEHEGRFGIDEQPKFWVKHALDLRSGTPHILKLICVEEFKIHVGEREVRCRRSAEKEARVLETVRGDPRFMQGRTARDVHGNLVRIIDFIRGPDLLTFLSGIPLSHEEYVWTRLPAIVEAAADSLAGIQRLHDCGLCHGDIRNDHILVAHESGRYTWIDFDLNEDSPLFDVWSAGNILHCIAAKGFVTFHDAAQTRPEYAAGLSHGDGSVFFPYRVMNLGKVYPYFPPLLNAVLRRFSFAAESPYDRMSQITDDLRECVSAMPRQG
ncbi:MAG TPA: hypothetical protein VGS58_13790 [Candidatus Sulfopaludibacter sp.]|nr:hypothetical protein [Candidatus Sulfopaludibacter sp.]